MNMKKLLLEFLIVFFCFSQILEGQKASITVESREILTYNFSDPNPIPTVTGGRNEIFPYHTFNGYTLKGQMQKWEVIKLENEYIEVYVLPENGGKVWGAIEKSTGKDFIYKNDVIKFRNISMRGPWTSGGIEFNFGIIGHSPSTCVPVDYKTVENEDGSVSCIVGNIDLPSRTKWYVDIRVPKDKAYFETRTMWNNPTPLPQPYYNWMTGAAATSADLQFAYPGDKEIGHGGEQGPWPVDDKGRDLSFYRNNNFESSKSYHIVGEYNDFMGGYYSHSENGFGHWALYDEMPGRKLFLWSLARDGGIWEDLLTDTHGQYWEFQAGRMFNQYGGSSAFKTPISQVPFTPGLTDRWTEIWFPVKEIGGLVDVSPFGVMNVKSESEKLLVAINSLAFVQAKITVRSGGNVILTEDKSFTPMDVYKTSVPLSSGTDYEVVVEGMDLQYNPAARNLIKRPFVSTMPKDILTASSLYQEGMELKENRNYSPAKGLFIKSLQEDPLYIDAMVALTELYYRSLQYDSALYYANNALQLDTYHPAANYFAGITWLAKGDLIDALETLGWAARSPEYRSVAYAQMAAIELQLKDYELTGHYAQLALNFNKDNFNALKVLAVLYRKLEEPAQAIKYTETIIMLDPLNHFADYERYLLHPSAENYSRFTSTILNEMPYQTYLEVCLDYLNLGQKNDALRVLDKAPEHPLILIWKAFLKDDPSLLNEVAVASPAFVFPYRTETVSALKWAASKNDSWKFKYYLALNYAAIQRDTDARKLMETCGQEPDYAPFYLARAAMINSNDNNKELMDLQLAQKLAPDDWRTDDRLIDYYEARQDFPMALTVSTAAYKKHRNNTAIRIKYAIALINNRQYARSLKILEDMNILPTEGSRQGKVVFEQTCLFLAMDLTQNKKYGEAIKMIEKSKEWPESLGVGKPFIVDTRIQDYLKIFCLEKLGLASETISLQKSIVDYTYQNKGPSFNNILAVMTLQDKGETEAANALISELSISENPVQRWVVAVGSNDKTAVDDLEKDFAKNINFMILKKIFEITNI